MFLLYTTTAEDFNGLVASYSFRAGLVPEPSVVFSSSGLALSDSLPEFTEGFLLYLDINERSLDTRDLQRLQTGNFKVVNPLVVVSVPSNDRKCLYLESNTQSLIVCPLHLIQ